MIFKRKIYNELLRWKKRAQGKTALLIDGARRIGKTTIVKEFAANNYGSSIYIDLSRAGGQMISIFNDMSDMDRFYSNLFLLAGKTLKERDGLIILDEVQFAPKARQAVKALCEDGRYDVIETGSLISLRRRRKRKENEQTMIPSEEERIEMFPLDFEEFCWAMGDDPTLFEIFRKVASEELPGNTISEPAHRRYMEMVRKYIALGGMPKVISTFLKTNSYYEAHQEKRNIVKLYRDDLSQLDNKEGTKCREVYDAIANRMRIEDSSRFFINGIFGEGKSDVLPATITNLADSKVATIVYDCHEPKPGLGLSKEDKMFKVYSGDVGLFAVLFLESNREEDVNDYYRRLIFDKLDANLGALYEHFVLQNLLSQGRLPYYFSFKDEGKRYEIDLLTYSSGKVVPIEVKSGRHFTTSSLLAFKKKYSSSVQKAYVLSPKMMKKDGNIIYFPIYFAGLF